MKKLLILTLAVAILAVSGVALAGEFPQQANPGNSEPQIYLIKKVFDICNPEPGHCVNVTSVNPVDYCSKATSETECKRKNIGGTYCQWVPDTGGSTPYGDQTIQYGGCKDAEEKRYGKYMFTGEQLFELVVVRDLNGEVDIVGADVIVDGELEAKCDPVTPTNYWRGHYVADLLLTIPPKKGPADKAGFDPNFDKLYECILTVEPSWYGESVVNIRARDQVGDVSTGAIEQTWFFNPAVILDLDTNDGAPSIWYEDGVPGQTVYSGNKLVITNLAEGGVDLLIFIAADDLTDPTHTAAKCPWSNVLDVDKYMEYNCKIGTLKDNEWHSITNKNTKLGCDGEVSLNPNWSFGDVQVCYGAKPILTEYLPIVMNLHEAECQFRLTYPVPCVGSFTEGLIHVIVRAV